jgi:hypothetical protein
LVLPILLAPLLYHFTPDLLRAASISREEISIPQIGTDKRDGLAYYLNPNKWGDMTAYEFGQDTLDSLAENAVVIAQYYIDTDEYFIFRYFAVVHGRRPDLTVVGWPTTDPFNFDPGNVLEVIDAELPNRPVYLASLSKGFYAAPSLLGAYCIVEEGNLYRVYERTDTAELSCLPPTADFLEP